MILRVIYTCVLAMSFVSAIEPSCQNVTVCPDDYSPHDGCVTLDQLLSADLINSNTIFTFAPATFKMTQDLVIRFENVANITLESAGAVISCVGKNAGFVFSNVSEVAVQNIQFIGCAASMYDHTTKFGPPEHHASCTFRVTESCNITFHSLTFKNVHGCGVYYRTTNICRHLGFNVLNSLFTGMHGPGVVFFSPQHKSPLQGHLTIANSQSQDNRCNASYNFTACAFQIELTSKFALVVEVANVTVTNNVRTCDMHGIYILLENCSSDHPTNNITLMLHRFNYSNNYVRDVTGTCLSEVFCDLKWKEKLLEFVMHDSYFINNTSTYTYTRSVQNDDAIKNYNSAILRISYSPHIKGNVTVSINKTTISNCYGWYDFVLSLDVNYKAQCKLSISNSAVVDNVLFSPIPYYKKTGAVHCKWFNITVRNMSIVNNSATGLLIVDSGLHFHGHTLLQGNHGYNGGGMALYGNSAVQYTDATVLFKDNVAKNVGGGLYAQLDLVHSHTDNCFLRETKPNKHTTFEFRNNEAQKAGKDWYGYMCRHDHLISQLTDSRNIEMTSDPWHVCDCTRSNEDCINVVRTVHRVQAYPGQLFNLSLIAVGTVLNTTTLSGVPSAIYAGVLPLNSSNPGRVSNDSLVHAGERVCSMLPYRIISTNQQEVMVLSTDGKIPDYYSSVLKLSLQQWHEVVNQNIHEATVPAYVTIELLPCPLGFESPTGECTCSDFLNDYDVNCSIDTMLITKKPHLWLSTEQDGNYSIMFLAHRHCPFDYCKPGEVAYSLDSPDAQCSGHRSGILCGRCKPGYSLTLGKSECRQCTNLYLLLLIPFALAGVLLIVFLSLTDMTVTAGTINGLLFFANIVGENHATFFPSQAAGSFLSVFIAWLNLDVGITTCFFNGLDSYVFTWLQFSFPIYILFLAFSITIASRHVDFVSKLCGRNIVPVLASLFLLSYTKLQRAISASLSFTAVDVSNGDKNFVWLEDGNVRYLQGKHIPLFLVSILFLIILFIPYTLSVMLGPWLQTKTRYRVFCWVLKLKPFFDVCFGPLKDKHRYWTGVLLVSRIILSLVSTGNVLGDDSVDLIAIVTLVIILLALLGQAGGVYKTWILTLLESFFLANLGILASVTLYNKESGGSQYASVCVSTGSAFAIFCLIVLYHCLKSIRVFVRQFKRNNQVEREDSNNSDDAESDDELFDAIDRGREENQAMVNVAEEWYNKAHDPDTY